MSRAALIIKLKRLTDSITETIELLEATCLNFNELDKKIIHLEELRRIKDDLHKKLPLIEALPEADLRKYEKQVGTYAVFVNRKRIYCDKVRIAAEGQLANDRVNELEVEINTPFQYLVSYKGAPVFSDALDRLEQHKASYTNLKNMLTKKPDLANPLLTIFLDQYREYRSAAETTHNQIAAETMKQKKLWNELQEICTQVQEYGIDLQADEPYKKFTAQAGQLASKKYGCEENNRALENILNQLKAAVGLLDSEKKELQTAIAEQVETYKSLFEKLEFVNSLHRKGIKPIPSFREKFCNTLDGVSDGCSFIKVLTDPSQSPFEDIEGLLENRNAVIMWDRYRNIYDNKIFYADQKSRTVNKLKRTVNISSDDFQELKRKFTDSYKLADENELKLITSATGCTQAKNNSSIHHSINFYQDKLASLKALNEEITQYMFNNKEFSCAMIGVINSLADRIGTFRLWIQAQAGEEVQFTQEEQSLFKKIKDYHPVAPNDDANLPSPESLLNLLLKVRDKLLLCKEKEDEMNYQKRAENVHRVVKIIQAIEVNFGNQNTEKDVQCYRNDLQKQLCEAWNHQFDEIDHTNIGASVEKIKLSSERRAGISEGLKALINEAYDTKERQIRENAQQRLDEIAPKIAPAGQVDGMSFLNRGLTNTWGIFAKTDSAKLDESEEVAANKKGV